MYLPFIHATCSDTSQHSIQISYIINGLRISFCTFQTTTTTKMNQPKNKQNFCAVQSIQWEFFVAQDQKMKTKRNKAIDVTIDIYILVHFDELIKSFQFFIFIFKTFAYFCYRNCTMFTCNRKYLTSKITTTMLQNSKHAS